MISLDRINKWDVYIYTKLHTVKVTDVKGHPRKFKVIKIHQYYKIRNMQVLLYF